MKRKRFTIEQCQKLRDMGLKVDEIQIMLDATKGPKHSVRAVLWVLSLDQSAIDVLRKGLNKSWTPSILISELRRAHVAPPTGGLRADNSTKRFFDGVYCFLRIRGRLSNHGNKRRS